MFGEELIFSFTMELIFSFTYGEELIFSFTMELIFSSIMVKNSCSLIFVVIAGLL